MSQLCKSCTLNQPAHHATILHGHFCTLNQPVHHATILHGHFCTLNQPVHHATILHRHFCTLNQPVHHATMLHRHFWALKQPAHHATNLNNPQFMTHSHFYYNFMSSGPIDLNLFLFKSQRSEGVSHSIFRIY